MAIKQRYKKQKKAGRNLFRFLIIAGIIAAAAAYFLLELQQRVFAANVQIDENEWVGFYIPSNATYSEVTGLLKISGFIKDMDSFKWVAEKKGYPDKVKPGHYRLRDRMNNNELVNMLRGGLQTPVKLTFSNVRTKGELAAKVAQYIEADSTSIMKALNDSTLLNKYGFTPSTVYAMVLPNTYEIWWNTGAEGFMKRMHREFEKFWTEERRETAGLVGLDPVEMATLASIVDEETVKADEKPTVAGLYINRLNKGIRLQADPTIKYVLGDFAISRVLSRDLIIDSPYNTYIYKGLPPGPIRFPSIPGIKAVLNYEHHDYLYMCAKDDFSGYHNFAKTLRQHNVNAAKYRRALYERKIWR
jgi:UPF0755 protein